MAATCTDPDTGERWGAFVIQGPNTGRANRGRHEEAAEEEKSGGNPAG